MITTYQELTNVFQEVSQATYQTFCTNYDFYTNRATMQYPIEVKVDSATNKYYARIITDYTLA